MVIVANTLSTVLTLPAMVMRMRMGTVQLIRRAGQRIPGAIMAQITAAMVKAMGDSTGYAVVLGTTTGRFVARVRIRYCSRSATVRGSP